MSRTPWTQCQLSLPPSPSHHFPPCNRKLEHRCHLEQLTLVTSGSYAKLEHPSGKSRSLCGLRAKTCLIPECPAGSTRKERVGKRQTHGLKQLVLEGEHHPALDTPSPSGAGADSLLCLCYVPARHGTLLGSPGLSLAHTPSSGSDMAGVGGADLMDIP